ncbi:unnamed protein product [Gongylonema pulchrum]|uniref:Leuk-A4-hydro_C domain-containing protein n=1 Tax=Gongylonema pulchrum TaxID=637853 RepID=A0A183DZE5_9BILA|nr:unnamed protein product [Gongylonema pulchrum]
MTSAIDLAELFMTVLEKSKTPASPELLDRFQELFDRLPALLEKDLDTGSGQDRRKQYISLALKWTMAVAEKRSHQRRGHPALHRRIAKSLWHEGNYAVARNHFMHSDDMESFATFLVQYQQKFGYNHEKDLFIAQAFLQVDFLRSL